VARIVPSPGLRGLNTNGYVPGFDVSSSTSWGKATRFHLRPGAMSSNEGLNTRVSARCRSTVESGALTVIVFGAGGAAPPAEVDACFEEAHPGATNPRTRSPAIHLPCPVI
jgi:hypothetical protein